MQGEAWTKREELILRRTFALKAMAGKSLTEKVTFSCVRLDDNGFYRTRVAIKSKAQRLGL